MNIKRFYVNPFQEACYVVSEAEGMQETECIIIDCGAYYPEEEDAIANYVAGAGLQPTAHLLTHAHLDHVFGTRFVYEKWGLLPILHEADSELYASVVEQARMFGLPLMREPLTEHLTIAAAPRYMGYLHTPGHTQGSVCWQMKEGVLFSGDTLFQSGVGRTDLPGGNYGQLMNSLGRLSTLDPKTLVYPGHGGSNSIRRETDENPYM